jgi:protein Shroom
LGEEQGLEGPSFYRPDHPGSNGVHCALSRWFQASLLQRLQLLQRQQEEAKELKEHVARREQTLRQVLERELPAEHLRSYCVLLASKARILSQQRSLDDRIRFLKDQLDTIWSDLSHHPLSPRLTWAPAIRPLNKQPFLATLI